MLAIVKNFVGPGSGSQHGDSGEDIGHIDQEGLEDYDVYPQISGMTLSAVEVERWENGRQDVLYSHNEAIVCKLASIHKVELE